MRTAVIAAFLAACSPFSSSTDDSSGSPADAGVDATLADAAPAPGVDGGDAGGASGTFCAMHSGALHCYDFDGPPPLADLTPSATGGAFMVEPTFPGSSAPNALVAHVTGQPAKVVVTAPTIDFSMMKGKTSSSTSISRSRWRRRTSSTSRGSTSASSRRRSPSTARAACSAVP